MKSDLQTLNLIDKKLAKYFARLLDITDDMAAIGVDLQNVAEKGLTNEVIDDAGFLRSCGYKLAEEGLCLTSLIISRIVYLKKRELSNDAHGSLNDLGDDILESIDPLLHDQLKMLGPYRYVS